jgi:hypothetical protein
VTSRARAEGIARMPSARYCRTPPRTLARVSECPLAASPKVSASCRKPDFTSLLRWGRQLLSADDLRKRAERLRKLPRETSKRQQKKEPSERQTRPRRHGYGVRTDNGPIALQAFWNMHVEAINLSGMCTPEYAAALGPVAAFAARLARSPRTIRYRNGLSFPDSSECPRATKQRC